MRLAFRTALPLPRERVVGLFRDATLRPRWQPGLVATRHLEGIPGEAGARSELVYELGLWRLVMIETLACCEPPERFVAHYAAEGIANVVENRFAAADGETRWELTSEFTLPPILGMMGPLIAPVLRAQVERTVAGFRDLIAAEAGRAGH